MTLSVPKSVWRCPLSSTIVFSYVTSHCVDTTSHPVESSAKTSYLVDSSATKKVGAQLQTNHTVEYSATKSHPVERSATNMEYLATKSHPIER